jgi:hypothetical protein
MSPLVTEPITPPRKGEQSDGARCEGRPSMTSGVPDAELSVMVKVIKPNCGVCAFTTATFPVTARQVAGPLKLTAP